MKSLLFLLICLPFIAFTQQFIVEETTFINPKDTVTLGATLTIPQNINYPPVAILISGSGQTDRDETIFQHKLFKGLAEYLSSQGIAVVRYDDRGGFKSTGRSVANSTSYELSEDAEMIMNQVRQDSRFAGSAVGFIGHSEGGFIAPMIAARNKSVDFIVSLAGTAVDGKAILFKQNRDIMLKQGVSEKAVDDYLTELFIPAINSIVETSDNETVKHKITQLTTTYRKDKGANSLVPAVFTSEKFAETLIAQIGGTWGRYFLSTDPKQFWQKVACPVLALNGDKDLQVDRDLNLLAIEQYLKEANLTKFVTIQTLLSHNHLFQVAKTGNILEYSQLKTGMSEETMQIVAKWIFGLN